MFLDKQSVYCSAIQPHANLHKRQNTLYVHQFREAITYNMVYFYHVSGGDNPADILSNHWKYTNIWGLLQPLIFCMVNTMDFLNLKLKRYGGK